MLHFNKMRAFHHRDIYRKIYVSLDLPSLAFPVIFLVLPFYKASLDAKATCINKLYKMGRLLFPMLMQNTSLNHLVHTITTNRKKHAL